MVVDTLRSYRRVLDGFDAVLAAVPADQWDAPSACTEWTVRDVVGHVVWGQEQMRHWATGSDHMQSAGAPGAPHPGAMARTDPVATWRQARAASDGALTEQALSRTAVLPALGERSLAAIVTLVVTDVLAHTWDIGQPLGIDPRLEADLISDSMAWARANVIRGPAFFGPELTPPTGADEQTRWLAYLGRAAWQPAPA